MEATKTYEELIKLYGEIQEVRLPSGRTAIIRMQNGADDDVISNSRLAMEGTNFAHFLTGIIIQASWKTGRLNVEDAMSIPVRDRNALLISSRVLSISEELKFQWTWEGESSPTWYTEDLVQFIWPYGELDYPHKPEDDGYFEGRIPPYPSFNDSGMIELTLESQKSFRLRYYDGNSDKYMINQSQEMTRNSELLARGIEYKGEDGKWVKIENFRMFTPKDMFAIRAAVDKLDGEASPIMSIPHPKNPQTVEKQYLLTLEGFLFPLEM